MSATKDERRLTDDDFWDMAALEGAQSLADARWADNGAAYSAEFVAVRSADIADHLLAERRKRREGGAQ